MNAGESRELGGIVVRVGVSTVAHGTVLQRPDDVTRFWERHPDGFVVARSDRLAALATEVPPMQEVVRHRRFLRRYDLVLLRRAPEMALPSTLIRR